VALPANDGAVDQTTSLSVQLVLLQERACTPTLPEAKFRVCQRFRLESGRPSLPDGTDGRSKRRKLRAIRLGVGDRLS
jgi:hypothetical protein